MPARKPSLQSFEEKYIPEPTSGCWLWIGALNGNGYGMFAAGGYKGFAHRFSWLTYKSEIPSGMSVCHKCDVPCCVNPDHLFLGTMSDNMRDAVRKGRHVSARHLDCYPKGINHWSHQKPEFRVRGVKNGQARLDDISVAEIRRRHKAGERQVDLATKFGVVEGTIGFVVRRETWKHLP